VSLDRRACAYIPERRKSENGIDGHGQSSRMFSINRCTPHLRSELREACLTDKRAARPWPEIMQITLVRSLPGPFVNRKKQELERSCFFPLLLGKYRLFNV